MDVFHPTVMKVKTCGYMSMARIPIVDISPMVRSYQRPLQIFLLSLPILSKFLDAGNNMNPNILHVQSRLAQRHIEMSTTDLIALAGRFDNSAAIIMGKRSSDEGRAYGMVLIILIVRNRMPITVMTRRETQNIDKRNFDVEKVVYHVH